MKSQILTQVIVVFTGVLLICTVYPSQTLRAEEAETSGNCLSYPVIWPEGEGGAFPSAFRGTPGLVELAGDYTTIDDVNWYYQQDEDNEWQADSAAITGSIAVGLIDWGDDLEARDWTTHSIVRVEVVLYQGPDTSALYSYDAYEMKYLSGQGPTEMYGTNGETYLITQDHPDGPTVYSNRAFLTIQKLPANDDAYLETLVWDPVDQQWEKDGVVAGVVYTSELCSAEVNVKGMVIYGYNWWVRDLPDPAGPYRITFSFDGETGVSFASAVIKAGEETSVKAQGKGGPRPPAGGGNANISYEDNVTYIDIAIADTHTGGGGGAGPKGPRR